MLPALPGPIGSHGKPPESQLQEPIPAPCYDSYDCLLTSLTKTTNRIFIYRVDASACRVPDFICYHEEEECIMYKS